MPKKEDASQYEATLPESVLRQQKAAEEAMQKITAPEHGNTSEKPAEESEPKITAPEPRNAQDVIIPAIPNSTEETFHHKYNVLKGKYDKEIADLRSKSVELESIIKRQEQVINELNSKQSETPSRPTQEVGDIDLEAFDSWGPEIKDMASTVNKLKAIINDQQQIISGLKSGSMTPANAPSVDPEIVSRLENLEEYGRKQTIEAYQKTLDTQCPQWVKLNTDPGFNAWLDIEDPVSMRVRRDIIANAASNFRGAQVANIFNAYLLEQDSGPVKKESIFQELPQGGGGGDQGETNRRPGTSLSDVKKAQDDYIKGRISEAEYDKISASYQRSLGRQ